MERAVDAVSLHYFLLIDLWICERLAISLLHTLVEAAVNTPTSYSETTIDAHCSRLNLVTSVPV